MEKKAGLGKDIEIVDARYLFIRNWRNDAASPSMAYLIDGKV